VPVDGYGVGTSLVTGSGAPTAALVYKLVARALDADPGSPLQPVAKRSVGKPGRGGRKWAVRSRDEHGTALTERISLVPPSEPGPLGRELLVPLVADGEVVDRQGAEATQAARAWHRQALAELPPYALQLSRGYPAIPTVFDPNGDET
jgi:nicotinate phosphoribosyltransferase